MAVALDELDATGTLALVDEVLLGRRAAEVDDLRLAAHWADLHAADPRLGPEGRRMFAPGGDRLVQVGGEGTPLVQDLCFAELGIARRVHPLTARALVADSLDLRHRLPLTWAEVRALRAEVWVARKVASLTRQLAPAAAAVVDAAVAEAIVGESPTKVIELAQAKVIEVDPAGHRARLEEQRRRRYVALSRSDECGLRLVIARVEAGDAVWVDAMLNRVADVLAGRPDLRPDTPAEVGRDELRSLAFGWLARPAELLTLLLDAADQPDPTDTDTDTGTEPTAPTRQRRRDRRDRPDAAGARPARPTGPTGLDRRGARARADEPDEEPTPEPDEDDDEDEGEGAGVSRAFAVPARVLDLLGRVDLTQAGADGDGVRAPAPGRGRGHHRWGGEGRGPRPAAARAGPRAAGPHERRAEAGGRPGRPGLGQRLRASRDRQGAGPPAHPGRGVPLRPGDRPQRRHGPPRPLRPARPTRGRPATTTPARCRGTRTGPRPTWATGSPRPG